MAPKSASPAAAQILAEIGLTELPQDWEIIRLEEVLAVDRGISVGVMYPGDHDPSGVPLIKAGDIANGRINPRPDFYISHAKHEEYRRTALAGGELLISLVGDVGRCAVVPPAMAGWNAARAIAVLRCSTSDDAAFVGRCLMSPALQHLMAVWATTTVQATLNLKEIRQIPLPWPPVKERKVINQILGTLDDKIELNHRTSETLEEMARALFKSWFVDFDPVRAKAEGRDPGLPPPLADLFADSFEDSELGEIPKGWEVKALGDLLELAYGKALKAEERRDGNIPVYGSNGQVGWHDERLAIGPGIVVGRKGNPGIATWVPTDFFPIDTTFYVVPKADCRSLTFLFHVLRTHDLASLGADSAVPGLNRNLAYMSRQVLPPAPLREQFDHLASAVSQRVHQANAETRTLAALRDVLLPKLISGELRVKQAENLAEEVA